VAYDRISYGSLVELSASILEKISYPASKADITAWVLAEADARGVSSHGVTRLKVYRNELEGGHANPCADPEIVHETPISLVVDGHYGVGAHISKFTMEKVIEKAKANGTCFASVRNSNHFGMAGLWAEMAVKEGLMGSAFTNTIRCAVPTLGKERLLGTDPIAVGIPSDRDLPWLRTWRPPRLPGESWESTSGEGSICRKAGLWASQEKRSLTLPRLPPYWPILQENGEVFSSSAGRLN